MAFGFPPKYTRELQLGTLSSEHFLAMAVEAVKQLDWSVLLVCETGMIVYTHVSMDIFCKKITINITGGSAGITSECQRQQLFDWGDNKNNVLDFISVFQEVKYTLTTEEIESKADALRKNYATKKEIASTELTPASVIKQTGFFSIFKPRAGYFITPILIDINILIFVVMCFTGMNAFTPDNETLLAWGANFRPVTLSGQWWRLVTCCFLHIGIFHLLLNMYALFYIGLILEPYLDRAKFLAAYLITGVSASIASIWWNNLTISAGASGAIFGMYGVFLALLTTNLVEKTTKKALMSSIVFFVGYNLIYGLKPGSGIDNAAHIGGLLSGLLVGYAFVPSMKHPDNIKIKQLTIGISAAILFLVTGAVCKNLPNDLGIYQSKMDDFVWMESQALNVYKLPKETTRAAMLTELKDKGIYYWNESIKLIDGFNDLDLPEPVKGRNVKLKEYCMLRIKCYELMCHAIEEDTDKYETEINECHLAIKRIVDELSKDK